MNCRIATHGVHPLPRRGGYGHRLALPRRVRLRPRPRGRGPLPGPQGAAPPQPRRLARCRPRPSTRSCLTHAHVDHTRRASPCSSAPGSEASRTARPRRATSLVLSGGGAARRVRGGRHALPARASSPRRSARSPASTSICGTTIGAVNACFLAASPHVPERPGRGARRTSGSRSGSRRSSTGARSRLAALPALPSADPCTGCASSRGASRTSSARRRSRASSAAGGLGAAPPEHPRGLPRRAYRHGDRPRDRARGRVRRDGAELPRLEPRPARRGAAALTSAPDHALASAPSRSSSGPSGSRAPGSSTARSARTSRSRPPSGSARTGSWSSALRQQARAGAAPLPRRARAAHHGGAARAAS